MQSRRASVKSRDVEAIEEKQNIPYVYRTIVETITRRWHVWTAFPRSAWERGFIFQ
jgi:hypothetical protein